MVTWVTDVGHSKLEGTPARLAGDSPGSRDLFCEKMAPLEKAETWIRPLPGESLIFKRPIWLLEQSPVGACLQREARVRRGSSKPCQCHPRRMPAVPVSELAILQLQPDEISDLFLGNQTTTFVHQICVLAIRNAPGLTPFVKKEGPSVSLHVLPRQAPQQPRRNILPPPPW